MSHNYPDKRDTMTAPKFEPVEISALAKGLGERIRVARIRRKLRQQDVQERTGLSRSTIQAIERGEVTTSLGAYLTVLQDLGLAATVEAVADPGLDRAGLALSMQTEKKRVFLPRRAGHG